MFKAALLTAAAALCAGLSGCAQRPALADTAAPVAAQARPACLQTGSRIPRKDADCGAVFGRSYSREDIERTGRIQGLAPALKALDPALL